MSRFLSSLTAWRVSQRLPVIGEIKPSTPQAGQLLDLAAVDRWVAQYENAQVVCLSVVTGHWFGGSLALLERVRGLTDLPLLRKDFIVSQQALDDSQRSGADAVLLTCRLLDPTSLRRLTDAALARGLTPFVEAADARELARLQLPPGCVVAVTNRDIGRRETDDGDFRHSLALLDAARRPGAGALVSASGIRSAEEVTQLIGAGYDAALVGTALLRAGDPAGWLRPLAEGLRRPPALSVANQPAVAEVAR